MAWMRPLGMKIVSPSGTGRRWTRSATWPACRAPLEIGARHRFGQPGENVRASFGVGEVPHLGFGLAVERLRHDGGRMDLQRKTVLGIEHFHEQRKACALRETAAEDFRAAGVP